MTPSVASSLYFSSNTFPSFPYHFSALQARGIRVSIALSIMAQATPASERSADGGSKLIENLQNARRIVLHDPRHYPTIVTAIQRCFQDKSNISARVWMANLLAESFGAPTWSQEQKEPQALAMLEILEGMVSEKDTNTEMVKSGIQIAASIYRIVFNYMWV